MIRHVSTSNDFVNLFLIEAAVRKLFRSRCTIALGGRIDVKGRARYSNRTMAPN